MILGESKMFKEKLYNILKEFKRLTKTHNKTQLLKKRVSKKLQNSLEQYNENLEETIKYLTSRNSVTVLKGIVQKFRKDETNE
jgi:F0F1-type ATP synthase delta subunit